MKNVGINHIRLLNGINIKEKLFAELWEKINPPHNETLSFLLYGTSSHDITPRDREVAATVIQWLGSYGGETFLDEVQQTYRKSHE